MNLAQLRALVSVIDEGGFTPAAAALGLTQSGVSHAVASLERELGLSLVSRARGGVALTAHGGRVIGHAREAVRHVDRIAEDAAAAAGQVRGRVRIGGFPSAAQLLPALIAEFARRLPEVQVVLLEGTDREVRSWLHDRVVDVGVLAELTDPADAHGVTDEHPLLWQDRMVAVLDRHHPLAGQPEIALADLTDDPFLLSDGGCEPLLRRMHTTAGVPFRPTRRVRDMATLLALVREQLGVTVIPELAITDTHGLVAVPVTPPARRTLRLVPAHPHDIPATVHALFVITRHRSPHAGHDVTVP